MTLLEYMACSFNSLETTIKQQITSSSSALLVAPTASTSSSNVQMMDLDVVNFNDESLGGLNPTVMLQSVTDLELFEQKIADSTVAKIYVSLF